MIYLTQSSQVAIKVRDLTNTGFSASYYLNLTNLYSGATQSYSLVEQFMSPYYSMFTLSVGTAANQIVNGQFYYDITDTTAGNVVDKGILEVKTATESNLKSLSDKKIIKGLNGRQ